MIVIDIIVTLVGSYCKIVKADGSLNIGKNNQIWNKVEEME